MPAGLTEVEARDRARRGQSNQVRDVTSRGVVDILKSNLLTRFNALLGSLLVVILVVGPLQDAVFGLILVANALIGIAQELRAKYTLDRLAIVAAPQAAVIRDGLPRRMPVGDIVQGDLLQLVAGDEVVVDGKLESNDHIELNEALLTGEAIPVVKKRGDQLLAGSFVTAGSGLLRAIQVGEESYARRVTSEARRFQLVPSELMRGINQILRLVTWIIVPTAALLIVSQLRANPSLGDAIRGSVAGMITLVPEGLVLLTSAAMALAVIRLGRKKVLIQQLAAVEMLARTDVVCLDKTGTLTEPGMTVAGVESIADSDGWRPAPSHMQIHIPIPRSKRSRSPIPPPTTGVSRRRSRFHQIASGAPRGFAITAGGSWARRTCCCGQPAARAHLHNELAPNRKQVGARCCSLEPSTWKPLVRFAAWSRSRWRRSPSRSNPARRRP